MPVARVIYFRSRDPELQVRAIMGPEPPKITDGYGGWETIERDKLVSVTEWRGGNPFRMSVPILLDGFADDEDVEADRAALERMGRKDGGNEQPPIVHCAIPGEVPRSADVEWVVENIDWGDEIRDREDGLRVRIFATILLLQYVKADNIKIKRSKRRKGGGGGGGGGVVGGGQPYTVRKGDTLGSIAAKQLGDSGRWHEIANLNNIRDPSSIKAGQVLKMPKK